MDTALESLVERVREAVGNRTPLRIRGGGTKDFYGNPPSGQVLDTRGLQGVVAYEPGELVVTARAGTSLAGLEAILAAQGQMLPFEPPHFGDDATVGGCVAAGLAGPRRASSGTTCGSVRDFVLGARLVDGRGQLLAFGGTVMKNVAGYDVARVLAGALGILGVIVEVSLKVLPRPVAETTLRFEMDEATALDRLNAWGGQPLPVSASTWCDGVLFLRLSGAPAALQAARVALGGQEVDGGELWTQIREQRHPFFAGDAPLWRLAVPTVAEPVRLGDGQMMEWGGAQRWLRWSRSMEEIRARARELGGHATLFRGGDRSQGVFTPPSPPLAAIHRRLKAEFDPAGIFNPGRMYPES
jgi:glycolate oxidase FAD binding subunit